jgi:hypothetical protein
MRKYALAIMGLVLLCLVAALGTAVSSPDTITVDSTTDVLDAAGDCGDVDIGDLPGSDTKTSLREAICAANNNAGSDTIAFNIPLTDTGYQVSGITGTWTIPLANSLPILSGGGTVIDGSTQATFIGGDPNPSGPEIEISGVGMGSGSCFSITSANNTIHGLVINQCSSFGISIGGSSATTNSIFGNYIGTDAAGSLDLGNGSTGVCIWGGAQNNFIGSTPAERNIISGNDWSGVRIDGSGTDGNRVRSNYIGTDASGSLDLGNAPHGVYIGGGAQNNLIGGDIGKRNIISGNDEYGVVISGSGTMSNTISSNYIGTDEGGLSDLGNTYDGVAIVSGAQNNLIGGDTPGQGNIISGNDGEGVFISDSGTDGNTVSGNYIGTNAGASIHLGNGFVGVYIWNGAQNNVIGGDTEGERNVISMNGAYGVSISGSGTDGNTVSGNYIGTDPAGSSERGNSAHGVYIWAGAQNNVIGGGAPGESNIIAFNDSNGVEVNGGGTIGNTITQNSIHSNTLMGIDLVSGGNTGLSAPAISGALCGGISGTAPANATVEVFTGPDEEGKTYLATTSADGGGTWSAPGPFFTLDTYLTATATDASGNTSEFSTAVTPVTCPQTFLPMIMKGY